MIALRSRLAAELIELLAMPEMGGRIAELEDEPAQMHYARLIARLVSLRDDVRS